MRNCIVFCYHVELLILPSYTNSRRVLHLLTYIVLLVRHSCFYTRTGSFEVSIILPQRLIELRMYLLLIVRGNNVLVSFPIGRLTLEVINTDLSVKSINN